MKLLNKLKSGLIIMAGMALMFGAMTAPVYADNCSEDDISLSGGVSCSQGKGQATKLFGEGSIVNTIINTMLFIVGILSVIMIIYAGITYVTSAGSKEKIDNSKKTLTYAIVGLVVSIVAYAIVNWVTGLWGSSN